MNVNNINTLILCYRVLLDDMCYNLVGNFINRGVDEMLKEDFAACFTRIGTYPRDESMRVLLKMLDGERRHIKLDALIAKTFGSAEMARIRIDSHEEYKTDHTYWAVY